MIQFPAYREIVKEYQSFQQELTEDLQDGILTNASAIQVLRDESGCILDWYYDPATMESDYDQMEQDYGTAYAQKAYRQYWRDRPKLTQITTLEALQEITAALNSWFGKER